MEILYSIFIGIIFGMIVGMIVGIGLQCRRDTPRKISVHAVASRKLSVHAVALCHGTVNLYQQSYQQSY